MSSQAMATLTFGRTAKPAMSFATTFARQSRCLRMLLVPSCEVTAHQLSRFRKTTGGHSRSFPRRDTHTVQVSFLLDTICTEHLTYRELPLSPSHPSYWNCLWRLCVY